MNKHLKMFFRGRVVVGIWGWVERILKLIPMLKASSCDCERFQEQIKSLENKVNSLVKNLQALQLQFDNNRKLEESVFSILSISSSHSLFYHYWIYALYLTLSIYPSMIFPLFMPFLFQLYVFHILFNNFIHIRYLWMLSSLF